jgi:perosamine synthetase
MNNIPVYEPYLIGNEKKYVNQCLDSNWISSKGEFINKFETKFASYIKVKHATTVSNGTVALHLALMALSIRKGDEVILPTLSYVASANSVKYVGAKPVFVDSEKDSWNIDPKKIEARITSKTKAIMAVHLYGAICNVKELKKICEKNNLYLIEDVAEGFGTKYNNKYAGTFGDVSTFSFYGNKTITTGEGGMVVSNDKKVIEKVKYLKNQAVSNTKEYWHDDVGYNYRMTNICAAIGLAQLENADLIIKKKIQISCWYKKFLTDSNVNFQKESTNSLHSFWMISIIVENKKLRDEIRQELKNNNIETRPLFPPMHTLPMYLEDNSCQIAESLSERGINLPSYPGLNIDQVSRICKIINKTIKKIML